MPQRWECAADLICEAGVCVAGVTGEGEGEGEEEADAGQPDAGDVLSDGATPLTRANKTDNGFSRGDDRRRETACARASSPRLESLARLLRGLSSRGERTVRHPRRERAHLIHDDVSPLTRQGKFRATTR
jgi:hypothetical protein